MVHALNVALLCFNAGHTLEQHLAQYQCRRGRPRCVRCDTRLIKGTLIESRQTAPRIRAGNRALRMEPDGQCGHAKTCKGHVSYEPFHVLYKNRELTPQYMTS